MTDVERKLWLKLREQDIGFRRQAPIGRYIVDFVSHQAKLVVELDGGQHNEPAAQTYDDVRTAWLETHGYRVLRFWNSDVNENLEGVLDTIVHAVCNPAHTLPALNGKGE